MVPHFMARPLLIPALERLGRAALGRRGVVSRDVDTPLGRVHAYQVQGRGSSEGRGELAPMCILHGYGSAATAFGPLILRLARHARSVVAPELPGHGFSEVPGARLDTEGLFAAMRHALDELLPEPSIVLGNSLGGAVALRYAIERPERVKALVLVSPAGAPMEDAELAALKAGFDFATRRDAHGFLQRIYERPPWFLPLIAGDLRKHFRQRHLRDFMESAEAADAIGAEEVSGLTMPILFVWGKSERILPPSGLAFFRRALPAHARIVEPEGFAHCPHIDDPARLTDLVVEFLRAELP